MLITEWPSRHGEAGLDHGYKFFVSLVQLDSRVFLPPTGRAGVPDKGRTG